MLHYAVFAALLAVGCATAPAIVDPVQPPGDPKLPRIIAPQDGDLLLDTKRPLFRWKLARGTDGAELEICRDRGCDQRVDIIQGRDGATPSVDLPSAPLFFRLRALAGGKRSEVATTPRRFQIVALIVVSAKHCDVLVPYDRQELGERLAKLADRAFERYAEWLGAHFTNERCRVEMVASARRYDELLQEGNLSRLRPEGFTRINRRGEGGSYVQLPDDSGAKRVRLSALEWATLHELAHCVSIRQNGAYYHDWPLWWREGLAELLSERALTELAETPRSGPRLVERRLRATRRLLDGGHWVPIAKLFELDLTDARNKDSKILDAVYVQGAALLHFLDSTPEYHERLETFIRYVATLEAFLFTRRVRDRLKELFGDLDALDVTWRTSLRNQTSP